MMNAGLPRTVSLENEKTNLEINLGLGKVSVREKSGNF